MEEERQYNKKQKQHRCNHVVLHSIITCTHLSLSLLLVILVLVVPTTYAFLIPWQKHTIVSTITTPTTCNKRKRSTPPQYNFVYGRDTTTITLLVMPLATEEDSSYDSIAATFKVGSDEEEDDDDDDDETSLDHIQVGIESKDDSIDNASSIHDHDGSNNKQSSSSNNNNANNNLNFLDWNEASLSIGSLLMQMQKKEEELKKFNKTLLNEELAIDLSSSSTTTTTTTTKTTTATKKNRKTKKKITTPTKSTHTSSSTSNKESMSSSSSPSSDRSNASTKSNRKKQPSSYKTSRSPFMSSSSSSQIQLNGIDYETAKELDDSVTIRLSPFVGSGVKVLELPAVYQVLQGQQQEMATYITDEEPTTTQQQQQQQEEEEGQSQTTAEEATIPQQDDNVETLAETSIAPPQTRTRTFPKKDDDVERSYYHEQIGRDMRHLAVATASCINDPEDWRIFCEQLQPIGGLTPLIQCIQEGARSIRERREDLPLSDLVSSRYEESFLAASSACRALRDICALSLDLAAVITDGLLRANEATVQDVATATAEAATTTGTAVNSKETELNGRRRQNSSSSSLSPPTSLMDDLCTLLQYSDENTEIGRATRRKGLLKLRKTQKPSKKWKMSFRRNRKDARVQCKLYVTQLLLAMTWASDSAVHAIRATDGLKETLIKCSSYARKERTRRWLRYPGEMIKYIWYQKNKNKNNAQHERGNNKNNDDRKESTSSTANDGEETEQQQQQPPRRRRRPFVEAAALSRDMNGKIQGTANQVLAAMGYNEWVPKSPGQKGLRILCLDGGGSRGMTSVTALDCMVEALGGLEASDSFDFIVGTSTGAIIAFLVGLRRESSELAVQRYDELIEKIFTKTALSTPLLLFTTATYDESPFMKILSEILGDYSMLDSRADPAMPFVFAVTSKMSSTPTHVALFRNYNYNSGELPDPFLIDPDDARDVLGLGLEMENENIQNNDYRQNNHNNDGINKDYENDDNENKKVNSPVFHQPVDGSRHPGSFRVLQRYALRASTAAPTVFKPVMMGGEMYCDGGIVASNPTAIAIHEARKLFPNIPIELVVSIGTGGFLEQKSAPRIGWDGIIGQIVNSATDGEQIHHIMEDILGDGGTAQLGRSHVSSTRYVRFNPILGLPDEFPIDVTDPEKLEKIKRITRAYMKEPEQQRKLNEIADILQGRGHGVMKKWFSSSSSRRDRSMSSTK